MILPLDQLAFGTQRADVHLDDCINTDAAYSLPEKGMVGNHAVFDPAVPDIPSSMINSALSIQKTRPGSKWNVTDKVSDHLSVQSIDAIIGMAT